MKNTVECVAIILIIVTVSLAYMRAGKRTFAISVLPLTLVPLFYTVAWLVEKYIMCSFSEFSKLNLVIVLTLLAMTGSTVLCSLSAAKFSKKAGAFFVATAAVFNVVLSAILIINNLQIILDK